MTTGKGSDPSDEVREYIFSTLKQWSSQEKLWPQPTGGDSAAKRKITQKEKINASPKEHVSTGLIDEEPYFKMVEDQEDIGLRIYIPRLNSPQDLSVRLQGDILNISGKSLTIRGKSRVSTAFQRLIRLPAEVKAEEIRAKYTKGYLIIYLKKKNDRPWYDVKVDFPDK